MRVPPVRLVGPRRALLPILVVALLPRIVAAQLHNGPFAPGAGWWIGPNSSIGLSVTGTTLRIDTNGNGILDSGDHSHPLPPVIQGWTLRLAPSRTILYAFQAGISCGFTSGDRVRLYAIPPSNNTALIPIGPGQICIENGIAFERFFDQPAVSPRRLLAVVARSGIGGTQRVYVTDLVAGVTGATNPQLSSNVLDVRFSPTGIAALVTADGSDGDALVDYHVLGTCLANLASDLTPGAGGPLRQQGALASAEVVGTTAAPQASIRPATQANPVLVTLDGCGIGVPPATGASCLPGGGCVDGVTQGYSDSLGGTFVAGASCATAGCPPAPAAPDLHLRVTGPATAVEREDATYVLWYANYGTAAATTLVVADEIPSGTTFVSASDGGTFAPFTQRVTWPTIATLAPGDSDSVTVRVNVSCGATAITQLGATLAASGGISLIAPGITAPVTPIPNAPVLATLTSVPLAPPPLHSGEVVRHTLHLVNTAAFAQEGVQFAVAVGNGTRFASVVDAGTGSAALTGFSLSWSGTLAPLGSTSIVWDAVVDRCRGAAPSVTRLNNNGSPFTVRDACMHGLATVTPTDSVALAPPPVVASMFATNLPTPTVPYPLYGTSLAVARRGTPVDFSITLRETEGVVVPRCTLAVSFPPGIDPVGSPPFLGTPPAGTGWDAAARRITFSSMLGARDSVRIDVRGVLDTSACWVQFSMSGQTDSCSNNLRAKLGIVSVALPPAVPHLLATAGAGEVWSVVPGPPVATRRLFCLPIETMTGIDRATDGTYWVSGLPAFRLNPVTLEFAFVPDSTVRAMPGNLHDVLFDPVDGSTLWLGSPGTPDWSIHRWQPATGTRTRLFGASDVPATVQVNDVRFDTDGNLLFLHGSGLARVPPAHPAGGSVYTDSTGRVPCAHAVDVDGDYLTVDHHLHQPRRLLEWNRLTGRYRVEVANLDSLVGSTQTYHAAAVAPDGALYLGGTGLLVRLGRGSGAASTVLAFLPVGDLVWVGGGTAPVDVPPRPAVSTLTLLPAVPQPFRSSTALRFALPRADDVELSVFDVAGREVRRLVDGPRAPGEHVVGWDGRRDDGTRAPAGVYFARLAAGTERRQVKLVRLE